MWADGGYAGRLADWGKSVLALTVHIIKRTDDTSGFKVLPRRWVVERTFGWMTRYRRLVRDYERCPDHHEAMVLWVNVAIMTRNSNKRHRVRRTSPDGDASAPAHQRPSSRPHECLRTGTKKSS
nr:transposase [Mycobacterium ostraviense]